MAIVYCPLIPDILKMPFYHELHAFLHRPGKGFLPVLRLSSFSGSTDSGMSGLAVAVFDSDAEADTETGSEMN